MLEARILGIVIGLVALVSGLVDYRRARRTSALLAIRDLAAILVGLALVVIGGFPRLFDWFAGVFGVDSLEGRRIGLLMVIAFAVLVWALYEAVGRIAKLEQQIGELGLELTVRTPRQASSIEDGSVAVVIPAFNEAEALPGVLEHVPDEVHGRPVSVIVVSDGSTDRTADVASSAKEGRVIVLDRPLRRGSGAAIRSGLRYAFENGAAIGVTIDADGQHDPRELQSMVKPLIDEEVDVVQGVRKVNAEEVSGSRMRVVGVRFFGRFLNSVLGIPVNDPSNGYRAIRSDAYHQLELYEDQFYVGELIVQSARAGLRISEVPITVSARSHGESKKPGAVGYGWGFARGILRALTRPTRPDR